MGAPGNVSCGNEFFIVDVRDVENVSLLQSLAELFFSARIFGFDKSRFAHEVDETGEFRLSHGVLESQTDQVFLFEEFGKSGDIHLCHPRYHKRIEVLDLGEDSLNENILPFKFLADQESQLVSLRKKALKIFVESRLSFLCFGMVRSVVTGAQKGLNQGEKKFRQPGLDLPVRIIRYLAAEKNVCV